MDKKTLRILLGVSAIILWFMPLAYVDMQGFGGGMFEGMQMYQTGQHIGGIAYLLLVSSALYIFGAWNANNQIMIIAAAISLGISMLFLVQAGSSAAWGLLSLCGIAILSLVVALKKDPQPKQPEP